MIDKATYPLISIIVFLVLISNIYYYVKYYFKKSLSIIKQLNHVAFIGILLSVLLILVHLTTAEIGIKEIMLFDVDISDEVVINGYRSHMQKIYLEIAIFLFFYMTAFYTNRKFKNMS